MAIDASDRHSNDIGGMATKYLPCIDGRVSIGRLLIMD